MAKQELDEGLGLGPLVPKGGLFYNLVSLFKFILSILILPLIIGLTISFTRQLILGENYILNTFVFGLIGYLILHLFIYQPHSFYSVEQGIINKLFGFLNPLKNLLCHRLPLFSVLVVISYLILKVFFDYRGIPGNFIFLLSFTASMHFVLAAVKLKEESTGVLKGDYFLSISTVYLIEIILVAFFIKVIAGSFAVNTFLKDGFSFFTDTYIAIWKQLFVMK